MWQLVAREPRPDAPEWPGRRLLAAVDAVVWPLMWVLLIQHAPQPLGLIGLAGDNHPDRSTTTILAGWP